VLAATCETVLADTALNKKVDLLLKSLGRSSSRQVARERLNELGEAVIPRLIYHARGRSQAMRALALCALQTNWSPSAKDVVVAALADRNQTVRNMANSALKLNLSREELAKVMTGLADSRNVLVAGPALQSAESAAPNADRMARAVARSGMWKYLDRVLPRYHSEKVTPGTRKMLDLAATQQKITAICSLIHQQDDSQKTRLKIVKRLRLGTSRLREMAAEYMRWHGRTEDLTALETALKGERDVYCRASLESAIKAIAKRSKLFGKDGDVGNIKWPTEPSKAYQAGIDLLTKNRSRGARAAVVELLRTAEPFEPLYDYGSRSNYSAAEIHARNDARLELLGLAFGYSGLHEDSTFLATVAASTRPSEGTAGIADRLLPPVREYFDAKRKSFGRFMTGTKGAFAGTHHVGDDVAWHRPQSTVVSIGNGVVKRAAAGVASWGGFVVIEHVDDKGEAFCSLYAHLGPLVCVRVGRRVKRGQKIGTVGRRFTWTNGGYGAHLHFGIHRGRFSGGMRVGDTVTVLVDGKPEKLKVISVDGSIAVVQGPESAKKLRIPNRRGWITGYLPPAKFKSGDHGWVDPQAFIRARRK